MPSPVIRRATLEREKLWEASPLPPEWSPESFAHACRRTALLILEGARRNWGKRELADWLTGPYERLAVPDEEMDEGMPVSSSEPSSKDPSCVVVPNRIDTLLEAMRADLLIVLRELTTTDGIAAFAQVAVATGLVALSTDVEGVDAIVPRSRRRMSLVERVMSLFAVDALVHPAAYESELVICPRCAVITFDAETRRYGACIIHASGVVLKR